MRAIVEMRPSAQISAPMLPIEVCTGAMFSPGANHCRSKCHRKCLSAVPARVPSLSNTTALLKTRPPAARAAPTTSTMRSLRRKARALVHGSGDFRAVVTGVSQHVCRKRPLGKHDECAPADAASRTLWTMRGQTWASDVRLCAAV